MKIKKLKNMLPGYKDLLDAQRTSNKVYEALMEFKVRPVKFCKVSGCDTEIPQNSTTCDEHSEIGKDPTIYKVWICDIDINKLGRICLHQRECSAFSIKSFNCRPITLTEVTK